MTKPSALINLIVTMEEKTKNNRLDTYYVLDEEYKKDSNLAAIDDNKFTPLMHAIKLQNEYAIEWILKKNKANWRKLNLAGDKDDYALLCLAVDFEDFGDNLEAKSEDPQSEMAYPKIGNENILRARRIVRLIQNKIDENYTEEFYHKGHSVLVATKANNLWFVRRKIDEFIRLYKIKTDKSPKEYLINYLPLSIQSSKAMAECWIKNRPQPFYALNSTAWFKGSNKDYSLSDNELLILLAPSMLDYFKQFSDMLTTTCLQRLLLLSLENKRGFKTHEILIKAICSRGQEASFQHYADCCFVAAAHLASLDTIKLMLKLLKINLSLDIKTALPISTTYTREASPENDRIKFLLAAVDATLRNLDGNLHGDLANRLVHVHPDDLSFLLEFTSNPFHTKVITECLHKHKILSVACAPPAEPTRNTEGHTNLIPFEAPHPPINPMYTPPELRNRLCASPTNFSLDVPEVKQHEGTSEPGVIPSPASTPRFFQPEKMCKASQIKTSCQLLMIEEDYWDDPILGEFVRQSAIKKLLTAMHGENVADKCMDVILDKQEKETFRATK